MKQSNTRDFIIVGLWNKKNIDTFVLYKDIPFTISTTNPESVYQTLNTSIPYDSWIACPIIQDFDEKTIHVEINKKSQISYFNYGTLQKLFSFLFRKNEKKIVSKTYGIAFISLQSILKRIRNEYLFQKIPLQGGDRTLSDFFLESINTQFPLILKQLTQEERNNLRLTSPLMNEIVKTYMKKNKDKITFTLPPFITNSEIESIIEEIETFCTSLGITPEDLVMKANFHILSKNDETDKQTLEKLEQIGSLGVRIVANIKLEKNSSDDFKQHFERLTTIIRKCKTITKLDLDFSTFMLGILAWPEDTKWFDETKQALQELHFLSSLRIVENAPWNHILECLPSLTNLRTLELVGTRRLESNKLNQALSQMGNITHLSLSQMTIEPQDLTTFLLEMKHLSSLNMTMITVKDFSRMQKENKQDFCEKISKALGECSTLQITTDVDINNTLLVVLPQLILPNLTSLELSNCNLYQHFNYISSLEHFNSLTSLNLSFNFLSGSTQLQTLGEIINKLDKLVSLDISSNGFTSKTIKRLIKPFRLKTLNKLNVSDNELKTEGITYVRQSFPYATIDFSNNYESMDEID